MLAHVPSFGRNPRGSPDFLPYPVPKACMHVLGTGVPKCLGVARSASSPKAAQALGCSLTPSLWISFGRVTCMARAASVPGLWTLGFHCCAALVFGSGLCLGWGFGRAPQLLAGVLGSLCACVRVPLVLRHSWLGCAVWVCVLGFGFGLRPATPGRGVGVCVCLCARSVCTPPLLAWVCGVGVCAWARLSAAPRHSWLGCLGCVCSCVRAPLVPCHSWLGCAAWLCVPGLGFRLRPASHGWGVGVCVFVYALRLYPAIPGWGVRRGCVCLGSGSGCAPPLLTGVLGCVYVRVRASLVLRHSWLGCAVLVCVPWPGLWLRPTFLGWGVGVCLCALRLYPASPGSGVWCGCVLGLLFWLRPATPGWDVEVCVCLCACSACTPPLLAGVCGVGVCAWARGSAAPRLSWLGCWGVRLCVRAPLVPRHSWLGCAAWVCVLGVGFRLRPPTPGCDVEVCVCSCARSAGAPPPLAGLCGVVGCTWAPASAAPRHSWLGCWAVRIRAPLVPRHSWLGCAVWVCGVGHGFWLRPAPPCWGVGVCARSCARFACTPPLLAGVYSAGVRAWARVSAVHRHSWLGCWGVCAFACAPLLYPATPGWGVRCGCVCFASGLSCAPPLLAGVLGVCFMCLLRLCPATPGCGVRRGCVCLGSGFGCAPQLRAGVLGCVCVRARAPLVPRHTWLGCAVWVGVLGLGLRLRPASPGWGIGVCVCALCLYSATPGCGVLCGRVCLGSGFGCAPPLLAGVLGCLCVCVCAALVPRHSWLLCCVGVCARAWVSVAPCHPWLGCWAVCVLVCALRLCPATPGWGVRCVGSVLPGTPSCAVFGCVLCALPGFAAPAGRCCLTPVLVPWLWPAACLSGVSVGPAWCAAPRPVGALSVLRLSFPTPWCLFPSRGLAPRALLGGCAGHAEGGREPGSLCLPLASAKAAALGSLRVVPVRGSAMGLSLAGPSGVGLGLRALRWCACVDPVTDASVFPYRPSFNGGLGRCIGAVSCGRHYV